MLAAYVSRQGPDSRDFKPERWPTRGFGFVVWGQKEAVLLPGLREQEGSY